MSLRLVLTFPLAPGVPGGGTMHFFRLALELAQAGANLTVVMVMSQSQSNFPRPRADDAMRQNPYLAALAEAGIGIRWVEQSTLSWWLDGVAVRREVARICRVESPDAVIGWFGEVAFLPRFLRERGILFAVIAAAPYTLRWNRSGRRPRWLHRWMDEQIVARPARRADLVIANSEFTRAEVISLLGVDPAKVRTIHPPLPRALAQLPPRNGSTEVERLIYFGRLTREKGIYDLIEALGMLRGETWALRIAGAGEHAAVESALRAQGIEDRVTMLGHLDESSLVAHLKWAQLAVLPSQMESFGLSVVEAQLSGLPVIAYEAGAIAEVMQSGRSGWMVPPGNIAALAEAIREALSQPEQTARRANSACSLARDRFLRESAGARIVREISSIKGIATPSCLTKNPRACVFTSAPTVDEP